MPLALVLSPKPLGCWGRRGRLYYELDSSIGNTLSEIITEVENTVVNPDGGGKQENFLWYRVFGSS